MNYCLLDTTGTEAPRVCEQWRVIFVSMNGHDLAREDVRTDSASRFGLSREAVHAWAADMCKTCGARGYRLECW